MSGRNATRKMLAMGRLALVCALTALAMTAINAIAQDDECVQGSIGPDGQPVHCLPESPPPGPQECVPGNPLPDGTFTTCPSPAPGPQECVMGSVGPDGEHVRCPDATPTITGAFTATVPLALAATPTAYLSRRAPRAALRRICRHYRFRACRRFLRKRR